MQALSLSETLTILEESRVLQEKYMTYRDPSIQVIITNLERTSEDVTLVRDILRIDNPDKYMDAGWIYQAVVRASQSITDLRSVLTVDKLFQIPPNYKVHIPTNIFGNDDEYKLCDKSRSALFDHGVGSLSHLKLILLAYQLALIDNGYSSSSGRWTDYSSYNSAGYSNSSDGSSSGYGGYSSSYGGGCSSSSGGGCSSGCSSSYSGGCSSSGCSGCSGGYIFGYGGGYGGYSPQMYSSYGFGGPVTATPLPPPNWLLSTTVTTPGVSTEATTTPVPPSSGFPTELDMSVLSETMEHVITYRNCTIQYRKFLQEVNSWLDHLTSLDYVLNFDFENMVRQFKGDIAWLEALKDDYITARLSKLSLARMITSDRSTGLVQSIEKEFNNINIKILTPLMHFSDIATSEVSEHYIQMLEYAARFKEFFREMDRFEDLAKESAIFKKPLPNIETPDVRSVKLCTRFICAMFICARFNGIVLLC